MQIKHLQQMILINRVILSEQYEYLAEYKRSKRWADENENQMAEYAYHNALKIIRKNIATLVDIQKALKAEVRKRVTDDRVKRTYQNSDGN